MLRRTLQYVVGVCCLCLQVGCIDSGTGLKTIVIDGNLPVGNPLMAATMLNHSRTFLTSGPTLEGQIISIIPGDEDSTCEDLSQNRLAALRIDLLGSKKSPVPKGFYPVVVPSAEVGPGPLALVELPQGASYSGGKPFFASSGTVTVVESTEENIKGSFTVTFAAANGQTLTGSSVFDLDVCE